MKEQKREQSSRTNRVRDNRSITASDNLCFHNLREKTRVLTGGLTLLTALAFSAPALANENSEPSQNKIPGTELVLENPLSIEPVNFPDVPQMHPYYEAIVGLAKDGIIGGYTDGRFGPEDTVKRAQFAKMIDGALGLAVTEDSWKDEVKPFMDLGEDNLTDLYPHDFVAVCAEKGITKGIQEGEFAPWQEITRAQVVTMAVRAALNLYPEKNNLKTPPAEYKSALGNFSDTHSEFMRIAEYNGLLMGLEGYNPLWDPWQNATRGEVAQVLYDLKNYERQTKKDFDLVNVKEFAETDSVFQNAQKAVSETITGVKYITAEHTVNADKEVDYYIATGESGKRYLCEDTSNGLISSEINPHFTIGDYGTYIMLGYWRGITYNFLQVQLTDIFTRRETDVTPQDYWNRISPIVGAISGRNEDGEGILMLTDEVKGVMKNCSSMYLFDNQYKTVISYKLNSDENRAIEEVIDNL